MKAEIKRDRNGNKIARIECKGFRSFSIQTNQNAPEAHRLSLGVKFDLEQPSIAGTELKRYILEFGTLYQQDALNLRNA